MKVSYSLIRKIIKEVLEEADIEDVSDIERTCGSTHTMSTCKIKGGKYYLKFSDENLFDDVDPSLQILVEYLAYRIYGLYSGISIPKIELVYDRNNKKVGIATTPAKGKPAVVYGEQGKLLAKMMSMGVYVDAFLANWDVIGTGTANVFTDEEIATRIDPGGALTFRAQGGRKGTKFSDKPGEMKTMFDPNFGGSGRVFQFSDLKVAAKEFMSVDWNTISSEIKKVYQEVSQELSEKGMSKLNDSWKNEVESIDTTLKSRHKEMISQIGMI